jgi:hypothetical protein
VSNIGSASDSIWRSYFVNLKLGYTGAKSLFSNPLYCPISFANMNLTGGAACGGVSSQHCEMSWDARNVGMGSARYLSFERIL